MFNLKSAIVSALLGNAALISLLGKDSIGQTAVYQQVAPEALVFPRITFFELSNVDSVYMDDDVFSSEISVQIDIWSKGNTSAIATEVDNTMRSIGWKRFGSQDLYEDDTQIFHKALRYETQYTP